MARSTSSAPTTRLVVEAPDQGTEIFVIDAGLRRIAGGVGRLEEDVAPGLYKVRFRAGGTQRDELVAVSGDETRQTVRAPALAFRSAAPLVHTQTTHEYHQGPANDASREVHATPGRGSQLFCFARDEDLTAEPFSPASVTIHAIDGAEIARLSDGPASEPHRWAALNLEADPGTYRVRVETEPLGRYEMFVTTSAGWQTQVFLVAEDFFRGESRVRRPSLRLASVLMARSGQGFDPRREDLRLAELARIGLAQGRRSMADDVLRSLLYGKFDDPLLGVYGAHLLLLGPSTDRSQFDTVCRNLSNLLGDHPDVRALQLRSSDKASASPIARPPMLRLGYDLIVAAARRRRSLVPPGSVLAAIGANTVAGAPWLLHRVSDESAEREAAALSPAQTRKLLRKLFTADTDSLRRLRAQSREGSEVLRGLEQSILQAAVRRPPAAKTRAKETEVMLDEGLEAAPAVEEIDLERIEQRMRAMMNNLKAPPASVAQSIQSLADKMGML